MTDAPLCIDAKSIRVLRYLATYDCAGHACAHCSVGGGRGRPQSVATDQLILALLAEMPQDAEFYYLGGEPLAQPDSCVRFLKQVLCETSVKVVLETSGIWFPGAAPALLQLLCEHRERLAVQVSYDGFHFAPGQSKETGALSLFRFCKRSQIEIGFFARSLGTKEDIDSRTEALLERALSYGVPSRDISLLGVCPIGRASRLSIAQKRSFPLQALQCDGCPWMSFDFAAPTGCKIDCHGDVYLCEGIRIEANVQGSEVRWDRRSCEAYAFLNHLRNGDLVGYLQRVKAAASDLRGDLNELRDSLFLDKCHACYSLRSVVRRDERYSKAFGSSRYYPAAIRVA